MRGLESAPRGTESAPHESLDDLRRHRRRFELRGVVRMLADQHAGLERLDRQRLALEHVVEHLERGSLETLDPAFDPDPVAMGRGNVEFRPRIHHGYADQAISVDDVLLRKTSGLEHDRCRIVEHREIARVVNDIGGVTIAPLDLHVAPVNEHELEYPSAAPCGARHRAAPLRRSNKGCRSCAAPARRTRRPDRAYAGTGSRRRASPAPPAANWRAAA